MTWNDHDHRGEYAASSHTHNGYELYDVAGEHHRHYDTESEVRGLREDLGRTLDRVSELEERQSRVLQVVREAARRHEAVRAAGLADQAYLPVSAELAEVLAELADAIEGKRCPCGEGTVGDCPGTWHGCDYHNDGEPELSTEEER